MFFLKDLPTRQMIDGYAATYDHVDPDRTNAALHLLRDASLLIRRIEKYLAQHDLSQTQFLILMILHRDKTRDHHLAAEIAQKMDVSKPVLSTAMKSLLRKGLIAYGDKIDDARAKPVQITPKGAAALERLLPDYFRILQSDPGDAGHDTKERP